MNPASSPGNPCKIPAPRHSGSEAIQKCPLNRSAGLPRFARNDKTDIHGYSLKDDLEYASKPFSGHGLPPFEKGGQGGFVVGMDMKIPHGPPFSKGEVKQCNAHLGMVQRHNLE